MWRPRARAGRSHKLRRLRLGRGRAVSDTNRRALVTNLRLQMLRDREKSLGGLRFAELGERGDRRNGAERAGRKLDIASRDGEPLALIGSDERRPSPALDDGSKLPAEIDRLLEPRMHADPARRRAFMRGIACDQDTALPVAFGDEIAALPARYRERLMGEVAAGHFAQERVGVFRAGRIVEHGEPPQLPAVDGDELRPAAALVDQPIEPCPALVVKVRERRRAEVDVDAARDHAEPAELNPEALAHNAGGAVAADQIGGANALGCAARHVGNLQRDAGFILVKGLKRRQVADLDVAKGRDPRREDRIEIDLRARAGGLGGDITLVALSIGGNLHAPQLASGECVEIDEVARMALGPHSVAHRVRHAPAPAELHVARADHALLGHGDGPVALLDQETFDPAHPELAGKPQADRPGAGDDYGGFGTGVHAVILYTPCLVYTWMSPLWMRKSSIRARRSCGSRPRSRSSPRRSRAAASLS